MLEVGPGLLITSDVLEEDDGALVSYFLAS